MGKKKAESGASKNGASASPAAYFFSLSLKNVRCFREKQTLDLSNGKGGPARWTILLGNNGTGKTTVLQSLASLALIGSNRQSRLSITVNESNEMGSLRRNDLSLGEVKATLAIHSELSRDNHHGLGAVGIDFTRDESTGTFFNILHPPVVGDGAIQVALQPAFGYGASRRLGGTASAVEEADAFGTLFSDTADLRNAEDWLLKLDYAASKSSQQQNRPQELRDRTVDLLRVLLPEIDDVRFNPGEGGYPRPSVEFYTKFGWVPLRQLGYGYQTVIAWVVDLASRMVERYPDSPNPLAEPAIVLVDEIDLHLHPTWQRKLIPMLTERFPNTQFIATAHSPLIVQAAGDANLAVLRREGDQVVIDNDVDTIRGWRIDQIYTSELFDLPSARPPEFDEPMKRRKELLMKPHLTAKDKRELAELEKQIGSLPGGETPEQIETMRLLQESLEVLREQRQTASP